MESAGLERIVRAEEVAHMGITEVIRHAPRVYGSYRRLVKSIQQRRPQAAILIDFPDVNLRLARELKRLHIPVVYFVSPQLWAWKRRRLQWVQQRVDRMMVIFPFEESFYRNRNVDATFTGHPLAELQRPSSTREQFASAYSLDRSKQWIGLLPGSRKKEILSNLPIMLKAAALLGENCEFLLPLASTIDPGDVEGLLAQPPSFPSIHLLQDAREVLFHAQASIVASGTATVQAALIGNPFIVVYKVSPLTFRLAKRLVHYPPEVWPSGVADEYGNLPIGMVNLIAGRRIVPELIQDNFTAANVASTLRPLLEDTPRRAQMMGEFAALRQKLLPPAAASSISQVADAVDLLLQRGRIPLPSV